MIQVMIDSKNGRLSAHIALVDHSVSISYRLSAAYDSRLAETKLLNVLGDHRLRYFCVRGDDVSLMTDFQTEQEAVEFLKTAGIAEVIEEIIL